MGQFLNFLMRTANVSDWLGATPGVGAFSEWCSGQQQAGCVSWHNVLISIHRGMPARPQAEANRPWWNTHPQAL